MTFRFYFSPRVPHGVHVKASQGLDSVVESRQLPGVKTISAEQAARQFEEYSRLAHEGERILVTLHGKPWILMAPATLPSASNEQTVIAPDRWPDFAARLDGSYSISATGPTASEILVEDRNDRF